MKKLDKYNMFLIGSVVGYLWGYLFCLGMR